MPQALLASTGLSLVSDRRDYSRGMKTPPHDHGRDIFVNRTLNFRSLDAIGYDMDYTLVHYDTVVWEGFAFQHAVDALSDSGWPVDGMSFDADGVIRGLVLDLELGNLLKATRFGYVIRASHGGSPLTFDEVRDAYVASLVSLSDRRFVFLNTLFSLSEASLFMQLVYRYDSGRLPQVKSYAALYGGVQNALRSAHLDGSLKRDILGDLEKAVILDPEVPLALLDQKSAGKRLVMITNSEWSYANKIMSYAFDRYLASDMTWRDLFDVVIVQADKPGFFDRNNRFYRVVDEDQAMLRPHSGDLVPGEVYFGGNASDMEASLGVAGDRFLYVGDHLYGDVQFPKAEMSWRTALILRELETEVRALDDFLESQAELSELMRQKEILNDAVAQACLGELRSEFGYGPREDVDEGSVDRLQREISDLDQRIAPIAIASGKLRNQTWGPLMRAGIDKSLFARQVERYADVYTSRVSNFANATPFAVLKASRTTMPHDIRD